MAWTEEDKQAMDNAAADAEIELGSIDDAIRDGKEKEPMIALANWWERYYLKAGHKRLARILLQYASKE